MLISVGETFDQPLIGQPLMRQTLSRMARYAEGERRC